MPEPAPFRFARTGRTRRTALVLVAVWAVIVALVVLLDAALWVVAIPALFTLPAVWDLVSDRRAGLALEDDRIRWHAGRAEGEVVFGQIDRVRFDTRLDLSVKVTLVLHSGRRIRLPQESLPPWRTLDSALAERGLRTERHHFALF
ncbi:hypothetical protein [Rhodosalinus sp.]|uniref:hypothetical protein n=1 Tax=Rhodosalinus sp. TaxID=2047741 RepID=UPI0035635C52